MNKRWICFAFMLFNLFLFCQEERIEDKRILFFANHTQAKMRALTLAYHSEIPRSILIKLSKDESHIVRQEVAETPYIPEDIMWALSKDSNVYVRKALVKNKAVPKIILNEMLNDKEPLVVAANKQATEDLLFKLVNASEEVNWTLANNPSSTSKILEKISFSTGKTYILFSIAEHSNTTLFTLKKIISYDNLKLKIKVLQNPNIPHSILIEYSKHENPSIRATVGSNQNTPKNILEKLSKDEDYIVRMRIAENPSTSVDVLEVLSKDKDSIVRKRIAENPSTPVDVLEVLSKDKDNSVKYNAIENLEKKKG